MDSLLQDLIPGLARVLGTTPEQLQAYVDARREQARQRVARNNQRYREALHSMTDVQSLVVDKHEASGYKINKLYVNRYSQRVAVMLVKRAVWNSAKGKIGCKLMMVYPDGSSSETFERSISIREEF